MTIQVAARKAPLYAEQTVHLDPPLIENALVGFLLEVTNIRVKKHYESKSVYTSDSNFGWSWKVF